MRRIYLLLVCCQSDRVAVAFKILLKRTPMEEEGDWGRISKLSQAVCCEATNTAEAKDMNATGGSYRCHNEPEIRSREKGLKWLGQGCGVCVSVKGPYMSMLASTLG